MHHLINGLMLLGSVLFLILGAYASGKSFEHGNVDFFGLFLGVLYISIGLVGCRTALVLMGL